MLLPNEKEIILQSKEGIDTILQLIRINHFTNGEKMFMALTGAAIDSLSCWV